MQGKYAFLNNKICHMMQEMMTFRRESLYLMEWCGSSVAYVVAVLISCLVMSEGWEDLTLVEAGDISCCNCVD